MAAGEHYIEFRNVSKSFGDHAVLKDVSFYIEQGETAVIMGRSGVGKSVSLKLLLGFLQPDEGRIIVGGKDVTDFTEEQFAAIRRKVTMVFQSGALLRLRERWRRIRTRFFMMSRRRWSIRSWPNT